MTNKLKGIVRYNHKGEPYLYYSKKDIVKAVAQKENYSYQEIAYMYNAFENVITEALTNVTPSMPVEVKIYSSVALTSKLTATKYLNLQSREVVAPERISVASKVSRTLKKAVNNSYNEKIEKIYNSDEDVSNE